jgi:hypothetical protein
MSRPVTDVAWHNADSNETQIWFVEDAKLTRRATVLDEDGKPALVGLPWSIVGFLTDEILWHNADTNETQIWLLSDHQITRRETVIGEDGEPAFVGPPWSIVGAVDTTGFADFGTQILWHNADTNETQIWFVREGKIRKRATELGEDGKPAFVGPPWSIKGVAVSFVREPGDEVK